MQLISKNSGFILLELIIASGLLMACVLSIIKLEAAVNWQLSHKLKTSNIASTPSNNCLIKSLDLGPEITRCVGENSQIYVKN